MKRLTFLPILLFLAACSSAGIMPTPAVSTPAIGAEPSLVKTPIHELTKTPVPIPTATETPDSLTNVPTGATGVDKDGNPIRVVEYENGQTYEFHLNEQGEWVRPVGEFPLIDNGEWEYILFKIGLSDKVLGGEYILNIVHPDSLDDNNRPITTRIKAMFTERLGISANDPEYYRLVNEEMDKGSKSDAKLPIITSDGEETFVRLSNVTGFILNVVSVDEISAKTAVQWFDASGATNYIHVTVDDQNNAVCTIASTAPLDKQNDKQLRDFLLSCVSHVFTQVDQRDYFNYTNGQGLGSFSADIVPSVGKPDMEIVIVE